MQLNNVWLSRAGNALLGAAVALGQAPFGLWPVTLAALLILMARFRVSDGFGYGWWAGLGYFALALHWIIEPFLVDVPRTGWMAPFALVGMAAGLALFWGAGFWVASRVRLHRLALVATWTLAEYARATILTGFPWALLGYAWIETPIAQAAAFVGPHILGASTLLTLVVVADLCRRRRPVLLAAPAAVFAAAWFGLAARIPDVPVLTDFTVRLVQPNAAQHLKWQPGMQQVFFDRQIASTSAEGMPDLIVWPEVAVPYLMGDRADLDQRIADVAANKAPVALGIRRIEEAAGRGSWRNSMMVLGTGGSVLARYDKYHLVPFGEFLPFPSLFDRFGLQALAANAGNFTPGPGPQAVAIVGLPPFQPLICYEAIFPAEILRGDDRPEWLLQLTNDAWFGKDTGPYQHLDQARMRAIEFGLPLARAANTGVSAMIDPYGRLLASIPLDSEGFVDARLPRALAPTLYSRTADIAWVLALVAYVLLLVVFSRRDTGGKTEPV